MPAEAMRCCGLQVPACCHDSLLPVPDCTHLQNFRLDAICNMLNSDYKISLFLSITTPASMNTSSPFDQPQAEGRRIVRKTAVELVVEKLRHRILNGMLTPGSQLRQEALAEELGVSRIPLREAFRLLSSEGLVEQKSHRSVMVSLLSAGEVEELFDIRLRLEPWLLYEAARKIDDAGLAEAERIVS